MRKIILLISLLWTTTGCGQLVFMDSTMTSDEKKNDNFAVCETNVYERQKCLDDGYKEYQIVYKNTIRIQQYLIPVHIIVWGVEDYINEFPNMTEEDKATFRTYKINNEALQSLKTQCKAYIEEDKLISKYTNYPMRWVTEKECIVGNIRL